MTSGPTWLNGGWSVGVGRGSPEKRRPRQPGGREPTVSDTTG